MKLCFLVDNIPMGRTVEFTVDVDVPCDTDVSACIGAVGEVLRSFPPEQWMDKDMKWCTQIDRNSGATFLYFLGFIDRQSEKKHE